MYLLLVYQLFDAISRTDVMRGMDVPNDTGNLTWDILYGYCPQRYRRKGILKKVKRCYIFNLLTYFEKGIQ